MGLSQDQRKNSEKGKPSAGWLTRQEWLRLKVHSLMKIPAICSSSPTAAKCSAGAGAVSVDRMAWAGRVKAANKPRLRARWERGMELLRVRCQM
jgi:hypothetical protein